MADETPQEKGERLLNTALQALTEFNAMPEKSKVRAPIGTAERICFFALEQFKK